MPTPPDRLGLRLRWQQQLAERAQHNRALEKR